MGNDNSRAIREFEHRASRIENNLFNTTTRLSTAEQKLEKLGKENSYCISLISKLGEACKLQEQVCSTEFEALNIKFNLEATRKEEQERREQLSKQQQLEMDVEMKLQKVMEIEKQVSLMNDEVFCTKVSLEASKKEEDELTERLLSLKKFQEDVEMKLEELMELEKQLSDTDIEFLSVKGDYEAIKKEENTLKEQLQSCDKFHEEMEMKLQRVMDLQKEVSFIRADDLFVKASLEASKKQEEWLKKQLSKISKHQQDLEIKLHKVLDVSTCEAQALSDMTRLEDFKKEAQELKEKLPSLEKLE